MLAANGSNSNRELALNYFLKNYSNYVYEYGNTPELLDIRFIPAECPPDNTEPVYYGRLSVCYTNVVLILMF